MFRNLFRESTIGFVVDWKRHKRNGWYSASTRYLVEEIVKAFNPIIISNQMTYDLCKKKLKVIISLELGVPKLRFDNKIKATKFLFYSDPHQSTTERLSYIDDNNIDYVLSFYHKPFFYHAPDFPRNKFVHFPWSIPDQFVFNDLIGVRGNEVAIFGGKNSPAYDVRNWCRAQEGVKTYDNSGVENKVLGDAAFYDWLNKFDAIIAAGSSNPEYDLVTPKYFEIAASGALLIGQYCEDLGLLGFDKTNSLIFKKENFSKTITSYRKKPKNYISIRENGRMLIKKRHLTSHRIELLKHLFKNA